MSLTRAQLWASGPRAEVIPQAPSCSCAGTLSADTPGAPARQDCLLSQLFEHVPATAGVARSQRREALEQCMRHVPRRCEQCLRVVTGSSRPAQAWRGAASFANGPSPSLPWRCDMEAELPGAKCFLLLSNRSGTSCSGDMCGRSTSDPHGAKRQLPGGAPLAVRLLRGLDRL